MTKSFLVQAAEILERVRAERPLVHNITNYVVMNTTANALLAIGASPAMVHAEEEAAEFVLAASSLVVNIGTLSPAWARAMTSAAARAYGRGTPWVLDPVAVFATSYRSAFVRDALALRPTIVRANASEVLALANEARGGRGVDATDDGAAAVGAAQALAKRAHVVVAMTGVVDFVTDGERVIALSNGDPMLARVTGTGCIASALVGAFVGVERENPMLAASGALLALGVAGEIAAARSRGPGSFAVELFDALGALDGDVLVRRGRMSRDEHESAK